MTVGDPRRVPDVEPTPSVFGEARGNAAGRRLHAIEVVLQVLEARGLVPTPE